MKHIYSFTILLGLLSSYTFGQSTTILTGLWNPTGVEPIGNQLYIAEYYANRIVSVDPEADNPTINPVIDASGISSILNVDGDIYFLATDNGGLNRLRFENGEPRRELIVNGLESPLDLAYHNNYIYISDVSRITRVDITSDNPTLETVIPNLDYPSGLAVRNDDLYIAEFYYNRISRLDLTGDDGLSTYFEGVSEPWDIEVLGDYLYIAEFTGSSQENPDEEAPGKISRLNLTEVNPELEDVIINMNLPTGIGVAENELYIVEWGTEEEPGRLSRFDLSNMAVNDIGNFKNIQLYSNAHKNQIALVGLDGETNYIVYDMLGTQVLKGSISNRDWINVQALKSGVYILKLDNNQTFKFIR
ncbi:T9SS type A sorting domain-containing protein [Flavobacteriaceae bacterium Ap0902]|nr:T9SS type A sorting domain-containing protein [Flavobacteriaceae bacterium Ap0902]